MLLFSVMGLSQNVYKASNFNIKSDGVHDNTTSIQGAIDFIASKGGGTLEFSVGRYITGAVQLKSGVSIRLREGAVIVGSTNIYSYKGRKAIFWGEGVENMSIFGTGVIDGRGPALLDDINAQIRMKHFRYVADISQSAACSFLFPFFGITVPFETNRFGGDNCFFQQAEDSFVFANSFFHQLFYRCPEFVQLVCHGRIDCNHRGSTVGRRTCGAEFETVSGECERRSTVAVGGIQ